MITYEKTNWVPKGEDGNIPSGAPPINAENLNKIEKGIEDCVKQINANTDTLSKINLESDVIWENENPDIAFEGTTIKEFEFDGDLTKYKRFSVLIASQIDPDNGNGYCEYIVSHKEKDIFLRTAPFTGSYEYGRLVSFSDSKITFSDGLRNGSGSFNNFAIPVQIIGYKY